MHAERQAIFALGLSVLWKHTWFSDIPLSTIHTENNSKKMSNGYNLCPFWSCYCWFPFKNSSITLWRNTKALYLNMIYFSLHIHLEFNSLYQGNSRMINVTSTTIIHFTWQVKVVLKTCITSWCFYIILGKRYIPSIFTLMAFWRKSCPRILRA